MYKDLPEGFKVIEDTGSEPVSTSLPEGFTLIDEVNASKPRSTVLNPVQEKNPFATANQPISTEPQLDLVNQRIIQPNLDSDAMQAQEATNVIAKYNNMFKKTSTGLKSLSWNKEDRDTAAYESSVLKNNLLKELKNRGIDNATINKDGQLVAIVNGQEQELDSSFLQDLWASKSELAGAVAGGIQGAKLGSRFGVAGTVGGGLVGGAVGAFAGKGIDIAINQLDIAQKIDSDLALQQMTEAGITDAVGGVIGHGVLKGLSLAGTKVKNLYNYISDNNIDGAYDYALKHFNLTDAQVKELVANVQAKIGPVTGTEKEQALKILATTQAGGEAIVKATDIFDPTASAQVANQVFDRAKQLKQATNELSADNIHQIVNKNLDTYINEVGNYYGAVKQAGKDFTEGYTFNYEQTGLKPILDEIGAKIEDPRIAQNYANLMQRVGDATEGRGFDDLVDLRQLVNEVKYNSGTISRAQSEKLDLIKNSIDDEIKQAAETYIPNSKRWMDSWSIAKLQYSEMKQLEKNVLFKALTKPGITEDQVVKSLSKYIGAPTDNLTGINVFNQVMDKLPKNVRSRVDGAVLDTLVEKYSAGAFGGNRAVHFPKLASEINKISWKNSSPKVQQVTRTINKMSEVFKNDVNLARVSGQIEIPKFQSYLTADPVVRLKYEVASSVFNYIKQLVPGDKANALSLLNNTSKLLENPLSSKTVKEMYSQLPKDRRNIRTKLDFDKVRNDLANEYMLRKQTLAQIQGTDNLVPRLVWKQPLQPKTTELPSGPSLYGTQRGTVSTSATKAIMQDRSDDLIADFVQNSIIAQGINERIGIRDAAGMHDRFAGKIHQYLDDKRLTNIGMSVRKKLLVDDAIANQNMVKKAIEAEANILIKRIEKDFGVKMPQAEADKIVRMKFKELMEKNK
jgi:hypothetical protein